MALVTIPAGSLIIPMGTTYQNNGMWTAYGLVYRLLQNGVPVKWAIASGKAYNGTDFTASATDFQTGTPILFNNYTGGPFIIDAAYAATATPIITAWQALYPNTKVHIVSSSFQANVEITLTQPARIAVEDKDRDMILRALNDAGIPDSAGNTWSSSSPGVLTENEQITSALFGGSTAACRRRVYDIFLSPNAGSGEWDNAIARANLDDYIRLGGDMHATGESIETIENQLHFLTTTLLNATNQGDTGTFTVVVPDYALDQAVPTTNPQQRPNGGDETWQRTSVTYYPTTRTMVYLTHNALQYDAMISGSYKGGTGAGTVTYEGGRDYSRNLPYLGNIEAPYLRFLLNSVLLATGLPEIDVTVSPASIPVGIASPVTVTALNRGGSDANSLSLTITLDASVIPASVVWSIPPTGGAFPTYTWTGLTGAASATVLTGTMTANPAAPGTVVMADFIATYADMDAITYTMDQCTTLQAVAGPIPVVTKTPDPLNTTPNQNVVWSIDTGNLAPVTLPDTTTLSNVVLTDTLPAGLTFVTAAPLPASITPGPGGTTILSWNLPNIPANTPIGGPATVTLTVHTPAHTTATYTNSVTLAGTDPAAAPFSATDTATMNLVNQAPTVSITQPLAPAMLTGTVQVCWNGSDPDGDPVTYDAYYSPDGGSTWVQFAFAVFGPNPVCVPWNTTGLNGSNFRLRVVVTDTVLTGQAEQGPFLVDNTPPTVALTAPPAGSTLCGQVILEADASNGGAGIASVVFEGSRDGGATWTTISSDMVGPPWSVTFATAFEPDGPIEIRAVATDKVGNQAISAVRSYTIDNTPPTVAITSPANGSAVSGTVTVQGTAADNIALDRVEWRIDGSLLATQVTPPFDFVWDTTQFIDGSHTFTLTAYDFCPNSAVATASFTVDNAPDHSTQVGVNGAIIIPPEKPDAAELADPIVQIEATETLVIRTPLGGKVIVSGVVHLLVPYLSAEPDQSMHAVEADLPWQTFILWQSLPAESPVTVTILPESQDFKLIDPRTISKYIVFLVGVDRA